MTQSFDEVMAIRKLPKPEDSEVKITGEDPVFTSRFKLGEATASILSGVGMRLQHAEVRCTYVSQILMESLSLFQPPHLWLTCVRLRNPGNAKMDAGIYRTSIFHICMTE